MSFAEIIKSQLIESAEIIKNLAQTHLEVIDSAADKLISSLKNGGTIYFCGNGGSAADCQHLAAELVAKLNFHRGALSALALTTDTSLITAISNDDNYSEIFKRQVEAYGKPGDVLVSISTSGNSSNIVNAVELAKQMKIHTVTLTGGSGGILKDKSDISIAIPSTNVQRIQESHITIGHIICDLVEQSIFGQNS